MHERLSGKVAIVTGAANGIGLGIAGRFAREGASVLLTDVNPEAGGAAAKALAAEGLQAAFLRAEVRDAGDCRRMVEEASNRWGGLDILVNNAGIGEGALMEALEEDVWDRVLDVNLKGVYLCSRAAFPAMKARGGGCILNISSLAGMLGSFGMGAYSASKGGVIQLTKVLAIEGASHKIRSNALCPVWIETDMVERFLTSTGAPELIRRRLRATIPMGRFGKVEDVVPAAVFLASDEAAFITGVALPIDGGTLCQ